MQDRVSYLVPYVGDQRSTSIGVDLINVAVAIKNRLPLSGLGNRCRKIAKIAALIAKQNNLNGLAIRFGSDQLFELSSDVINITQNANAHGAAIQTDLYRNTFTVNDTVPTGSGQFDDAFIFDWNGPVRAHIDNNRFDMAAAEQAQAINFRTESITDQVELSIQNNIIDVNNVTRNVGAVDVHIAGPALMNTFEFRTAGNLLTIGDGGTLGGRPRGLRYTMASNSGLALVNNDIISSADGATGIEIARSAASSAFTIDGNRIGLADFGTSPERGIIFSQVTGVVRLFGTINNLVIIQQNNLLGNGVVETPFSMPIGSNIGQIIVNGVRVP